MAGGGWMGLTFGQTPAVPKWNPITATGAQADAVSGNQAAMPGLENLASGVDTFNEQQLMQLFNSVMPGFTAATTTAGANIESELSGKIPTDVSEAVQSSDAAKALTGGFGGSGLSGNLTARDLGITSLDLTGQGLSSLESWSSMIDKMFAPGQFNVSSMFIDPQTEFTDEFQNQEAAFSAQWLKNQVGAMPSPQAAGMYKMTSGIVSGLMGGMSGGMMK
jgi:hypothetical protein